LNTKVRQTVDLAIDWWRLVAAVIFDVDFHDASVLGEDVGEILRGLVAVAYRTRQSALHWEYISALSRNALRSSSVNSEHYDIQPTLTRSIIQPCVISVIKSYYAITV